jgi:hypothetical protein
LVWKRPENPVGLLLAGFGLSFTVGVISEAVALSGTAFSEWAAFLETWLWALSMLIIIVLLPLLFPEGRLPSPRLKWVIPVAFSGLVLLVLGNAFKPWASFETPDGEVMVDLPVTLPFSAAVFDALALIGMAVIVTAVLGAVGGVVIRFRRSTGLERQQMRVFGAGLSVTVIVAFTNFVLFEMGHETLGNVLFVAGLSTLTCSIAVAVLRYRLYDLGRVISRTITYSIVAVLVAIVYGFGAVWLPSVLLGEQSPIFVAGSTLVVAALFNPTRRRVMGWVDRRFNRSRYDAERVAQDFAGSLRDEVHDSEMVDGWVGAVTRTMQPASVGVWVRD